MCMRGLANWREELGIGSKMDDEMERMEKHAVREPRH
jgi:hypothetical protein